MQYLLLIYGEESVWANMPPDQLAHEMGAYFAYKQELDKAGVVISASQLQPVASAKTVTVADGRQEVVDGPFSVTKEALGGFYLIQCETMDEATAWAAKCPGARRGRVEVRPLVMR